MLLSGDVEGQEDIPMSWEKNILASFSNLWDSGWRVLKRICLNY